MSNIFTVKKEIIPSKLIYKSKIKKITKVNDYLKIKYYNLYIDNTTKYIKIKLVFPHPNCDPKTGWFCLPPKFKVEVFTKEIKDSIEGILSTYNLDNCYFSPWRHFRYK